jgi:hypothetical protein
MGIVEGRRELELLQLSTPERNCIGGPEQKSITTTATRPPISGALLLSRFNREGWPRAQRLAEAGVTGAWSG